MTSLSTPLPFSGPDAAIPIPVRASKRAKIHRLGRFALNLLIVVVCLLTALFIAFNAFAAYFLSHPSVAALGSNPLLAKNLAYSDVTFASADEQTTVDGWWIPAYDSRRTVVLSHGYGTNREEPWVPMYDLADLLHGLNYNVLMFDYGFASKTRSTPATGGKIESQQLLGALQFARRQGSDELVVWGFSMGAGTALQSALQSKVADAMILDSTFLADDNTLYYNIARFVQLPKYPTLSLIRLFFPLMSGARLEQIPSAEVQATAYDFPILLIHGTADDKAPEYLAENIASVQTNALSQLWVVPGAIHEMIYRTHTEEYVQRATAFLESVHQEVAASRVEPNLLAQAPTP
ncbi:alpha/beta hydrolase [Cohnella terricola]|uniref:Alpha/beta hydrolase n=1 Tax=Cohnella terricola TaxID=1289167 RepID=A0A559JTL9_9BACL|nr:alpha/beta hydrolase [Cohnella terricola]TVY03223.1 alpha/beta hydrolase [Cohnella terricola]